LIETITLTERAEESVLKGLALAREMGAQPLVEQLEADLARVRDPSPPGQGRAAPPR
jgi:hypothetical protein